METTKAFEVLHSGGVEAPPARKRIVPPDLAAIAGS